TPCGPSAVPTGGAGVALPAGICNFTSAWIFLAISWTLGSRRQAFGVSGLKPNAQSPKPASDLLHLQEIELNGRGPAEDRHHDLQRVLVHVHFVHDAVEACERPFVDPDLITLVERVLRLRLLGGRLDLLEDLIDFALA